jgi:hypothetical protein
MKVGHMSHFWRITTSPAYGSELGAIALATN